MTLQDFTTRRRDELSEFFKARFGCHWRQIVARQVGLHPRTFQYWKYARATSLYRQLLKLEEWARSVGFQSPLDQEFQTRLEEHQKFQKAAQEAIQEHESKRNQSESWTFGPDSHELSRKLWEAMQRCREEEGVSPPK
jgi:hypothetical protein